MGVGVTIENNGFVVVRFTFRYLLETVFMLVFLEFTYYWNDMLQ